MFRSASRSAFALGRRQLFVKPSSPLKPLIPCWRASHCPYTTTSGKISEPLRILFCGSDGFSVEALRALHEEWEWNRELVEKIEVVVPSAKARGRYNKDTTASFCTLAAKDLKLPYHEIRTFKGWEMPEDINLIITASFGLLVPSRLLQQAKYGGLNVHPSFLPDLRGPAPIHHATLRGDEYMGGSLQTMDEHKFDHGVVLSQTPKPGLRIIQHPTLSKTNRKLSVECSELLIQGLRDGKHIPPYEDAGWKAAELEGQPLQHAPKITQHDLEVDWDNWTPEDWSRRLQIKQKVWSLGRVQKMKNKEKQEAKRNPLQRILFHDAKQVPAEEVHGSPGIMEMETATPAKEDRVEGEEPTVFKKVIRVDKHGGDVYVLLYGETWLRLRRATVQNRTENYAAVGIRQFIVEW